MLKGIHVVFKGMPLFWGRGYLSRALAVMERAATGDVKLSKDTVRTKNLKECFNFMCLMKNQSEKKGFSVLVIKKLVNELYVVVFCLLHAEVYI